jgi:hypothetical protein
MKLGIAPYSPRESSSTPGPSTLNADLSRFSARAFALGNMAKRLSGLHFVAIGDQKDANNIGATSRLKLSQLVTSTT